MTPSHDTMHQYWTQLKPFEAEQYLRTSLSTLASIALFALLEAGIEGSFDNAAVAMFRMFPEKFKLVSFPEYPDFIRIDNTLRLDCRHSHLVTGNRVKGFALTSHGKIIAQEALELLRSGKNILVSQDQKGTFSRTRRNRETRLVDEVRKSEAFQKFVSGKKDEISHYEICDVLHATLDTAPVILRRNLDLLRQYSRDLLELAEFHEMATMVLRFLDFLEVRLGA